MKEIKINITNTEKINKALLDVNGRAKQHTYTTAIEIICLAESAEKKLERLLSRKKDFVGAEMLYTSGDRVANAYGNSRIGTSVVIRRGSTGWFLKSVNSEKLSIYGGKSGQLTLTEDQNTSAIELLQKKYNVKKMVLLSIKLEQQFNNHSVMHT